MRVLDSELKEWIVSYSGIDMGSDSRIKISINDIIMSGMSTEAFTAPRRLTQIIILKITRKHVIMV